MATQKFTLKQTAQEVQELLDSIPNKLDAGVETTESIYFSDPSSGYINSVGILNPTPNGASTDFISLSGVTKITYYLKISDAGSEICFYDTNKQYIPDLNVVGINLWRTNTIDLTAEKEKYTNAKYCRLSIYHGQESNWQSRYRITISKKGDATDLFNQFNDLKNSVDQLKDVFKDKNILIYGDSITTGASFTINDQTQTTKYTFSGMNSYVDEAEVTHHYSMWPKIINDNFKLKEMRNYACSGAAWKDRADLSDQRQKLDYQVTLSLNDIDNPGGAFQSAHFTPDIIIFALGTNDGSGDSPTTTADFASWSNNFYKQYKSALSKDFNELTSTNTFAEAVRKSLGRVKKQWPTALCIVWLPINRGSGDVVTWANRQILTWMAHYEGCIVLDGAECGITPENNVNSGLGATLKDGLHPNDKGQQLMARQIIKCIESHYLDLSTFNED